MDDPMELAAEIQRQRRLLAGLLDAGGEEESNE
jgi:hypothetical protein